MKNYILLLYLFTSFNLLAQEDQQTEFSKINVGSDAVDYQSVFEPYVAEWDLELNGRIVGSATTHLRHDVFQGKSVYHAGSIIRYISMGNKPFADMGYFSKTDFSLLQARNAISQEEEITTLIVDNEMRQFYLNIKSGKITEEKTFILDDKINGAGIFTMLSMDLKKGLKFQLPTMGLENVQWENIEIKCMENITIESLDKTFKAWRIEGSNGTVKWVMNEAPYLLKWKMSTGMEWNLKGFTN